MDSHGVLKCLLGIFPFLFQGACEECDAEVEPHLTAAIAAMPEPETARMNCSSGGRVNGVALWMSWQLSEEEEEDGAVLCTGPVSPVKEGELIEWDMHSKQGVHLLSGCADKKEEEEGSSAFVEARLRFDPREADIGFTFRLQ